MRRDIAERGRDIDGVLKQYTKFVKPSFDDYIQPSKKHADGRCWFCFLFLFCFFSKFNNNW